MWGVWFLHKDPNLWAHGFNVESITPKIMILHYFMQDFGHISILWLFDNVGPKLLQHILSKIIVLCPWYLARSILWVFFAVLALLETSFLLYI